MKKTAYYEYLRVVSTIAVIIIHVVMTLPNNYTIEKLGRYPSAVMYGAYLMVNWAVPVFLMITGALLLNPDRNMGEKKILQYILRMVYVLLVFGTGFAVLEIVFQERTISLSVLIRAFLNMLQGKSWSHMWYIYTLIGLYLITIPLRNMIKNMEHRQVKGLLFILLVGNFVVPTINILLGTEFESYMQFTHYITYFLLGYYISVIPVEKVRKGQWALLFIATTVLRFSLNYIWVINYGEICSLVQQGRFFVLIQAVSLFMLFKEMFCNSNKEISGWIVNISRCSFAIYLIHPVFINILYKVVGFTPMTMPIGVGILVMTIIIFTLSWLTGNIMIKIPYLNKIV